MPEIVHTLEEILRQNRSTLRSRWRQDQTKASVCVIPTVPISYYNRWMFVLYRLIIRNMARRDNNLSAFILRTVRHQDYSQIPIYAVSDELSGINALKRLTIDLLIDHCQDQPDQFQKLCNVLTAEIESARTLIVTINENYRKDLEQRLERQIKGLFVIHEIGRALQQTIDIDEILYIVLVGVTAGQALKFNRAFLFLLDEPHTHIEGRMAIGPSSPEEAGRIWTELSEKSLTLNDILRSYRSYRTETSVQDTRLNERVRRVRIPMSDTEHMLVQALTTRASFNIMDANVSPAVPADFLNLIESRAFAVVPLISQEKRLGVLLADNHITGRPIREEDLERLEIFAQQASATIENSYLYHAQARQVRALEEANRNLRLYQEKLIHAERLSAIGEMAATVAHEIRNPLVAIGGFARALLRATPPESANREYLDIIINEGARLEEILTELLDLARPVQLRTTATDLNQLIRSALLMIEEDIRARRIRIDARLEPDLPPVPLDTDHIKQVLLNLFKNALDAMPRDGCLTVWTSTPGHAWVEIGIMDTGTGIAEEDQERIFEPFFTTKPGGSGLGLTVASRIIQDHGGVIRVDSIRGKGTTFLLNLSTQATEIQYSARAESLIASPHET